MRAPQKITLRLLLLLVGFLPIVAGLVIAVRKLRPVSVFDGGQYIKAHNSVLFVGDYGNRFRGYQRFYWLDLSTEQEQELESPTHYGLWQSFEFVDSQGQVYGITPADNLVVSSIAGSKSMLVGTSRDILVGQYLVRSAFGPDEQSRRIEWQDIESSSPTQVNVARVAGHVGYPLTCIEGTNSFYSVRDVRELKSRAKRRNLRRQAPKQFRSELCEFSIFSLDGSKLSFIRTFQGYSGDVRSDGGKLVHLAPARDRMIVRDGSTGEVESEHRFNQRVLETWSLYNSVLTLRFANSSVETYCLQSGRKMEIPDTWQNLVFDRSEHEYLTVGLAGTTPGWRWDPHIQIRDNATDAILRQFSFPDRDCYFGTPSSGVHFAGNGELLFLTIDQRAIFVDSETGQTNRTVAPRRKFKLLGLVCAISGFAWWLVWLHQTRSLPWFSFVNVFACSLLVCALSYVRLTTTGAIFYNPSDVSWLPLATIVAYYWVLVSFTATSLRTRLHWRILPAIIYAALFVAIYCQYLGWHQSTRSNLVFFALSAAWLLLLVVLSPNMNPFRKLTGPSTSKRPWFLRWSLAGLLLTTTSIALVIALVQSQDWDDWSFALRPDRIAKMLITSLAYSVIVYGGWYLAYAGRVWVRCIVAVVLMFAGATLYLTRQWYQRPFFAWDWYDFQSMAEIVFMLVATTAVLTLPFRVRLYREGRPLL